MKFGVCMFPTHYGMPLTELGREAEDLGFESIFFPEHTHIPSSRKTPWPGGPELPREYSNTVDVFVAMAAVAAVTKTINIGPGICLVIERDPITLAKEVASLDHISNGRFLFGIGAGWNREEMENHGTNPKTRFRLLKDRVQAMKTIWTQDEAEYHGEFVSFDKIWSWPKPVQRPHPPVLLGNDGPGAVDRAVDYADEWMPHPGRGDVPIGERIAELNAKAKAAGKTIPVTLFGAAPDAAVVEQCIKDGASRVVMRLPSDGTEATRPVLKQCAEIMRALR
ncbi:MAG: LLM class F420-dependent oxidoreductase [Chloroflexota bacterium]